MNFHHHDDPEAQDFHSFLQDLLNNDLLEGAALGITKQVIDQGEKSLTPAQQNVYKTFVLDKHPQKDCTRCGAPIPWSEMVASYDNGGHCNYCWHMMNKDD